MRYAALRAAAMASAVAYRAEQRIGPLFGAMCGFAYGAFEVVRYGSRAGVSLSEFPLTEAAPVVFGASAIFGFSGWVYRQVSDRHVRDVRAEGETPALERIAEKLNHRAERARFWDAYRQ